VDSAVWYCRVCEALVLSVRQNTFCLAIMMIIWHFCIDCVFMVYTLCVLDIALENMHKQRLFSG
jgi:hypothetical protein